jgi:hypothetical protein
MSRDYLIKMISATTDSPTVLSRLLGVSPQRADQLLHPKKHAARLQTKKLIKPDRCQVCNVKTINLEWHHYNYDQPGAGIWVCVACHNIIT